MSSIKRIYEKVLEMSDAQAFMMLSHLDFYSPERQVKACRAVRNGVYFKNERKTGNSVASHVRVPVREGTEDVRDADRSVQLAGSESVGRGISFARRLYRRWSRFTLPKKIQ